MPDSLPDEIVQSLSVLDEDLRERIQVALAPVAMEIGPREMAVLDRLAKGIAGNSPPPELNAFVRLLPVTVSRVLQPVLDPVIAKA